MQPISDIARVHLHWSLTDGVGPRTFGKILIQLGDPAAALGASAATLEQVRGIGRETAEKVARSRDAADVDAEIAAAAAHGVRIVCREDPEYPEILKEIADPPIVLYLKGELRPTDAVAIAIVGSRRCTIYGSEQARRFGELLAGAGFTVVSGLARGIDAFAHHGAVDAGGRSIAVLGCGLDAIYPPENLALGEKLIEHGCLISELPIRSSVQAGNFPPRNRIIAGLSLGVLVVEAAHRSGALITARLASEYNREVFAVPGRVQDPMSIGTNRLISVGGAKLVACLEDILDGLGEVGQKMRAAAGLEKYDGDTAAGTDDDRRSGSSLDSDGDRAGDEARSADLVGPADAVGTVHPTLFDEGSSRDASATADATGKGAAAASTSPPGTAGRAKPAKPAKSPKSADSTAGSARTTPALKLSPIEKAVFDVMGVDPILQSAVMSVLPALPPGEILAAFTALELKGLIRRLPGQLVARRGIA